MIYLDNSATTKPKKEVIDAFVKVNEHFYANPASLHEMGNQAEDLLETARNQLKELLHMEQIIFTSGGTEANNLALIGTARQYKQRGKHIITSETEHPSVLNTLVALEQEGFEVTRLPVEQTGEISLDKLKNAIRNDTILVSLMHVNNEIGTVNPIARIAKMLEQRRIFFHVDAVQSIGKLSFDPSAMPNLLTVSGHKIHGLKGTGLLAYSDVELEAIQFGGGQEAGHRSGTVAVPNAVALAKALRLTAPNPDMPQWNQELREFFSQFNEVKIISPKQAAPHILAIALKGIKGEILVSGLQKESIIVSTSSACSSKKRKASPVIQAIGVPREFKDGIIRISFGEFTTEQDIFALKKAFQRVYRMIKGA